MPENIKNVLKVVNKLEETNPDSPHPELQQGEVWIGNMTEKIFQQKKYKSKRKGEVAYDSSGNKIEGDEYFPVFVLKKYLPGHVDMLVSGL